MRDGIVVAVTSGTRATQQSLCSHRPAIGHENVRNQAGTLNKTRWLATLFRPFIWESKMTRAEGSS